MDELVKLIVKKTGIPKEIAQQVVKIVVDYLNKKLPAPFGSQVEAFLNKQGAVAGAEQLLGNLTASLGKKKK